jgi:4-aminobutyrate aminotransferase-like enzyme
MPETLVVNEIYLSLQGESTLAGLPCIFVRLGDFLLRELKRTVGNPQFDISIRGLGLMAGVELCLRGRVPATIAALRIIKEMLHRGFILLPEGAHGNAISFTPPLTITRWQLTAAVEALQKVLNHK